ncbi:MAG: cysteine peptidase family C39 domain-containing protein [Bacilli bacterium]
MTFKQILLTQSKEKGCGKAVVRMLLSYTHKSRSFLTLPLNQDIGNMLAIKKVAAEYGVTLEGRKYENSADILKIKAPFIMQITRKGIPHFVLTKVKKGKLHINDPSGDFYVLSLKSVQKYFNGRLLVVNCVEKRNPPLKPKFKYTRKPLYIHGVFILFIVLGFSFLGLPHIDLLSYIFFTLAAVTKICEQQTIVASFTKFDVHYISPKLPLYKDDFSKTFMPLQKAKEKVFSYPLRQFTSFSTIIIISILLLINNVLLFIVALYLVFFAFIDHYVTNKNGEREWAISNSHDDLFTAEKTKRAALYNNLIKDSGKLAKRHIYRNVIVHFSLGVLIILLMYFSNTFTLNFLTFYFFGFAYYYYELKKLLSLLLTKKAYYQAINIILNK